MTVLCWCFSADSPIKQRQSNRTQYRQQRLKTEMAVTEKAVAVRRKAIHQFRGSFSLTDIQSLIDRISFTGLLRHSSLRGFCTADGFFRISAPDNSTRLRR